MKQNKFNLSNLLSLDLSYFIKGGSWLTLNTLITLLTGLFTSALFARLWPADVFGQYSFIVNTLSFISLAGLPGMGLAITQASAEGYDGTFIIILKKVFKWSLLGLSTLFFGGIYFYLRQNPNLGLSFFVIAILFPANAVGNFYMAYLNGKRQFKKIAVLGLINQIIPTLLTALALFLLPNLIIVTLASLGSTAVINLLISLFLISQIKDKRSDPKLINLGFHLSISQIFTIAADYFDRLLVPLLLGFSNNAVYAFATMIPLQIHAFFKTFTNLGQPKIAEQSEDSLQKGLIRKSLQLEFLILLIILIYILVAPMIFHILFPAYEKNALYLSQLFSLSLLYFPSNLLGLGLVKKRATKSLYYLNVIYFIISVITLLIFIPTWGLIGAIISKILTRFLYALFQIYFFKRSIRS